LLLDDGFNYADVIKELGDLGKNLHPDHIRRWKAGGYQDYLREQRLAAECRARSQRVFDLLRQAGHVSGFQATQQIATAQICEALAEAGAEILREALAANPLNYFRMLNAFSRLTTGGLKCERLLDDQAQRAADRTHKKRSATKAGLSKAALKEMNEKLHLM
jgi:hypothetical protein